MFQDFLIKKMLKGQGASDDQIDQMLTLVSKNPDLFKKIAGEIQTKIKSGLDQTEAAIVVMKEHEIELRQLL